MISNVKVAKTNSMEKKEKRIYPRLGCAMLLLLGLVSLYYDIASKGIDTDTWFILTNGRYILENGFPTENPFTIHEGLSIVLSQPLTAVLEYLVYQAFSYAGLRMWVFAFGLLACFLTWKLSKACDKTKVAAIPILLMTTFILVCTDFLSNRPMLLTISITLAEMLVLEDYQQHMRKRVLFWLPVLSLIQINVHSSLYVVLFLPVIAYLAQDMLLLGGTVIAHAKKSDSGLERITGFFLLERAPRLPLIAAVVAMPVVALINPYGYKALTYLFESYDAATSGITIIELEKPYILSSYSVYWILVLIALCVWLCKRKEKAVNSFHFFLCLGGLLAYPMAYRNLWLLFVFSLPLAVDMLAECRDIMARLQKATIEVVSLGKCLVLLGLYCGTLCMMISPAGTISDSQGTPTFAVSYLENYFAGVDKESLKIYTGFNNGAYMEWCGYKTYIDARPELYQEQGIYEEYCDLYSGKISDMSAFLEKYDFDALIVPGTKYLDVELAHHSEYTLVYESSEYRIWVKTAEG